MKKKLLSKHLYGVFLLAITFIFLNGCKKNEIQDFEQISDPKILQAKGWYDQAYPKSSTKKTNDFVLDGKVVNLSQLITPDWSKSESYVRHDDDIMEIPIEDPSQFGISFKTDDGLEVKDPKASRSVFLLMKNAGGYRGFIMTLIGTPEYLQGDYSKLANNRYNKRDPNFCGVLIYHTPDGKFINNWFFKDGKVVDAPNSNKSSEGKSTNGYTTVDCIYFYTQVTSFGIVGPWKLERIANCDVVYHPDGNAGGSGGGGSGSGTGGGGGGSGTSTTNPDVVDPCLTGGGGGQVQEAKFKDVRGNTPWTPGPSGGVGGDDGEDDGGYPPPRVVECPPGSSPIVIDDNAPDPLESYNKLCATSFHFYTIVEPEPNYPGWKEAVIEGAVINCNPEGYLESLWNAMTTGSPMTSAKFNFQVGAPGTYPNHAIATDAAWAANRAISTIAERRGVDGLRNMIRLGTLPKTFATVMEGFLKSRIPGARVNSMIGNRTPPYPPVIGINCQ